MIPNQGATVPPGDLWEHLETFSAVTIGEGCHWHLVVEARDAVKSYNIHSATPPLHPLHHTLPSQPYPPLQQQGIIWPKNVNSAKVEKAWARIVKIINIHTHTIFPRPQLLSPPSPTTPLNQARVRNLTEAIYNLEVKV